MYKIYCHVFPNGKRYVGLTSTDLQVRWRNGLGYATCPLMDRAIRKYGWENIKHEVLAETNDLKCAIDLERYYIALFDTTSEHNGYNVLPGGDVSENELTPEIRHKLGNGWRGKTRSEVEKQKISKGVKQVFSRPESNGHIGMRHNEDTTRKMSVSQRKAWCNDKRKIAASDRMSERMSDPEFRKKVLDNLSQQPKRKKGEWSMPESAKAKLSRHFTGKFIGEKSPCSKAVIQYSSDGKFIKRWATASDVERSGIAYRSNVSKCCRRVPHVKTVGGFVWRFEGDSFD